MRTPSWEASPGALAALLNSGALLERADCFTFRLPSGQVLRWSGSDVATSFGGVTFALGPGITRDRCRWVVGVEVSVLNVTLTDNISTTIAGQPLMAFIRARGLYGAQVWLERAFWAHGDAGPRGALVWFAGRVADASVDRYGAKLEVVSHVELLNAPVPRDVVQPGCLNTLYDSLCGVNRAAATVLGAATAGTSVLRTTIGHALPQAAGFFDLGVITMTSGANAGQARTVKRHTSGEIQVLQPWAGVVAAGDTFTIVPGCAKSMGVCDSKFNNLGRFRGFPFVPEPETVT